MGIKFCRTLFTSMQGGWAKIHLVKVVENELNGGHKIFWQQTPGSFAVVAAQSFVFCLFRFKVAVNWAGARA